MADETLIIEKSNIKIQKKICRTYVKKPAGKSTVARQAANGLIKKAIAELDKCGIFDLLNAPLKDDKLSITVKLIIWEDGFMGMLLKEKGDIGALTFGGNPITINFQLPLIKDLGVEDLMKVIIHEMLHAQENAYEEAGKKTPYGGHATEAWKQKQAALIKVITDKLAKKAKELGDRQKELEEFMKKMSKGKKDKDASEGKGSGGGDPKETPEKTPEKNSEKTPDKEKPANRKDGN